MAAVKILRRRIGSPLAPLNPGHFQWLGDGLAVTLRIGNRICVVVLPPEAVNQVLGSALRAAGVPVAPVVAGPPTIAGLWGRVKRAAKKAAPKVVERATRKASRQLEQVARSKGVRALRAAASQAADVYADPRMAAALGAVSAAVPVLAPVTAPMAAGSLYASQARTASRGLRQLSRGDYRAAALEVAQRNPHFASARTVAKLARRGG